MLMVSSSHAAGSSLTPAVFGLLGALIGGVCTGGATYLVAWQSRKAAERAWLRDNRREIYDQFLACAQGLLIACETYKHARHKKGKAKVSVESAFTRFWEVYSLVQIVADARLFKAARIYGYRLWELVTSLGSTSVMGPEKFDDVAKLVRAARHDTIAKMRADLLLGHNPVSDINPFDGTALKKLYDRAERDRPGPLALPGDGEESLAPNLPIYLRKPDETGEDS